MDFQSVGFVSLPHSLSLPPRRCRRADTDADRRPHLIRHQVSDVPALRQLVATGP